MYKVIYFCEKLININRKYARGSICLYKCPGHIVAPKPCFNWVSSAVSSRWTDKSNLRPKMIGRAIHFGIQVMD